MKPGLRDEDGHLFFDNYHIQYQSNIVPISFQYHIIPMNYIISMLFQTSIPIQAQSCLIFTYPYLS